MLTAADLIAKLQKLPPETVLVVERVAYGNLFYDEVSAVFRREGVAALVARKRRGIYRDRDRV